MSGPVLQSVFLVVLDHSVEAFSHLDIRGCVRPSVSPSARHIRVEFLSNGLNLNKIAYPTHLISELCQTCFLVSRLLGHEFTVEDFFFIFKCAVASL